MSKDSCYQETMARIEAVCAGESDPIALMASISCELYHGLEHVHWAGFYRHSEPETLVIGPYQGGHGCLRIPFSRGICGACARLRQTELVPDVHARPEHIACASSTRSEIVVPVIAGDRLLAVLDLDSDDPAAFDTIDQRWLERCCADLAARWSMSA